MLTHFRDLFRSEANLRSLLCYPPPPTCSACSKSIKQLVQLNKKAHNFITIWQNKTQNFGDPTIQNSQLWRYLMQKKNAKSCHLLEESILCRCCCCRSVSPRSKGGRCATDSNSLKLRKSRKCAAAGGRGLGPPNRRLPFLSQCPLALTKDFQSHV